MKLQKQSEMQDFLTHWELMKIYLSNGRNIHFEFYDRGENDNGSERDAKPGAGISAGCNSGNLGGGSS